MERKFLVVLENAVIRRSNGRLYIENKKGSYSFPVRYLEALVIAGNASLTSSAVGMLMDENVPVFFMTRFGRIKGMLLPYILSSAINSRLRQYEASKNSLNIAREIVKMKIKNIEKQFCLDLKEIKDKLNSSKNLDEIIGLEGLASKRMFESFKESINGILPFKGREYYPPRDQTNALLSLSYTFTYYLALPIVIVQGYDPFISFLHRKRGTHASFCSDIMEPVRPLITKKVEKAIREKLFRKTDFAKRKGGFYLKKESYEKFLRWFESIKEEVIREIRETLEKVGGLM